MLITLADGPCPAKSVHLYCEGQYTPTVTGDQTCRLTSSIACQIDYRYNYSVYRGQRTYYDDQPHAIQVADRVFIELQVVEVFKTAMDVSWSVIPCFSARPSLTLTGYVI